MIRVWSFYSKDTGLFSQSFFEAETEEFIALNAPDNCAWIEGRFDYLTQRVDLNNQQIVTHVWSPSEAMLLEQEKKLAMAVILEMESKQHRRVRELLMQSDPKLQAIDAEIETLRRKLK
jgi:hypothetical protein